MLLMRVTVIEQIPTIQPHGRRSAPWERCEEEMAHWLSVTSRVTGSAVSCVCTTAHLYQLRDPGDGCFPQINERKAGRNHAHHRLHFESWWVHEHFEVFHAANTIQRQEKTKSPN